MKSQNNCKTKIQIIYKYKIQWSIEQNMKSLIG